MKSPLFRGIAIFISSLSLIAFGFFSTPAIAEEEQGTVMELNPVSARFALSPGETKERTYEVKNTSSEPYSIKVYAKPYSAKGDEYSLDFETETTYTQLSRWVSIENADEEYVEEAEFTIEPGETKTIRYRIEVPEDVAGGGQYASLFSEILPNKNNEGSGITTASRGGIILYAVIDGETRSGVKLGDIGVKSLVTAGNIGVYANIENTGNVVLQSSTTITVSSLFGKELYTDTVISEVLPETTRKVYIEWGNTPFFGLYRLHYLISALGTEAESNQIILVIPTIALIVVVILLVSTIVLIIIYSRKKKENRSKHKQPNIIIGN